MVWLRESIRAWFRVGPGSGYGLGLICRARVRCVLVLEPVMYELSFLISDHQISKVVEGRQLKI